MSVYVTFDGMSGTGKGTLIQALADFLQRRGHSATIIKDKDIDPLRDIGRRMLPWCERHSVNRNAFLFPLFVAGNVLAEEALWEVERAEKEYDEKLEFILRDRSFISSPGYILSSAYSQEDVWGMYVETMGVRVPDLAVIVDADVDRAMEREAKRKQVDKGLGGKMSGDRESRMRIRSNFLKVPEIFANRLNTLIVENNGGWTGDAAVIQQRTTAIVDEIVSRLKAIVGVRI